MNGNIPTWLEGMANKSLEPMSAAGCVCSEFVALLSAALIAQLRALAGWSMVQRLRIIFFANFCLCIAFQFAWLAYGCAHSLPIREKFLLFESGRGEPAWTGIFIGPALLAGYFASRPDFNRLARLSAAMLGVWSLLWALGVRYLLSTIYDDHPFIFNFETAVGIYILVSQVGLAVFWKARG